MESVSTLADKSAAMEADEVRGRLRAAIRDRNENAADLSRRLGRGVGYLSDFLRGKKETIAAAESVTLEKALDLPLGALHVTGDTGFRPVGTSPSDGFYKPPPQFFGERNLPVFAAVEGGAGEMVISTDAIDHVVRPWFLKDVKDGYAVVVTGESMVPVYEPGDLVIVNPRLPAIRGKNAIFVADEEEGGFTATVKRLEKATSTEWHVRQWNPPDGGKPDFTLPKKKWPKALRIVGRYEGG